VEILVVAAAAFFISRRALWGVLFFWLNLSPLLVAPPRDTGYVLYVALFGLAFALGSALGVLPSKLDAAPRRQWIATVVCFAAVFLLHSADYRQMKDYVLPLAAEIREVADQVPQMMPAPRSKVAILMLNSPLETTSEWEATYILRLKYGRRDLSVKMKRWDPVTTPLKVNPAEYQCVFQYDRFLHKYSKITKAAYAGIDRIPPPAWAAMGSSEAELCIVNDVEPAYDSKSRRGRQNPEFRFTAGPGGATRFVLDIYVPDVFLREAGPRRVQLFLDGQAGVTQTIEGVGDSRVKFNLPRRLSPGEPVHIRLQVANPWVAKEDGTRISFLIRAAGLE
jgi:hypothetical protein